MLEKRELDSILLSHAITALRGVVSFIVYDPQNLVDLTERCR